MNKNGLSFVELLFALAALSGLGYALYLNSDSLGMFGKQGGLPAQATQAVDLHNSAVKKAEAENLRLKCELNGGANCESK